MIPRRDELGSELRPRTMHSSDTSRRGEPLPQTAEYQSLNLAEHLSQIIFVVTPQGRGDYFNPYWRTYTGQNQEESLNHGWMRKFHPEELDEFLGRLRTSVEGHSWECVARIRSADGSYRRNLCRCSAVTHGANGGSNVLVSCIEVPNRQEFLSNQEETLLGVCLRTHDEEKRKIAHVLHDSAGQYLIALQMKLEGLQRSSIGSTGRKNAIVEECRELVKRCHKEIRATSYLLYPPLLDDLGLEPAVHLHVNGFMERTKIRVELDAEPNLGRLDRCLESALFRVVQEGLATLQGQGAVNEINIKIGGAATNVFVEVAGHGAANVLPAQVMTAHRASGIAITLLRRQILEMGGLFEIESLSGGMVIRAAVPRRALVAQACD